MIASRMRTAAAAVLLAASAVSGGAQAQQPAPAAPAASQIAPSHLAAAREFALVLKMDEPLKAVLDEMQNQVLSTMTTTRPEILNDLKQILVSMNPDIAARREEMLDAGARTLATRFSEQEIGDLIKFFKTPLGAKYLEKQPEALNDFLAQVPPWITRLNEFVIERIRTEMKKKGHDL